VQDLVSPSRRAALRHFAKAAMARASSADVRLDVLECPTCHGRLRILEAFVETEQLERLLKLTLRAPEAVS